jgi:hypothetical protein
MPNSDFNMLATFVYKPSSFFQKKYMNSFVHMNPRFKLIIEYLQNFEQFEKAVRTNRQNFPFDHLFDRLHDAIDSPNVEMRTLALDIVVLVHSLRGFKKIEPFIRALKQSQI